jgi:hypothetical protein
MMQTSALRAGDLVEVRSKEEILATLDGHSRLEGLPFMPEMLDFCGMRFRVSNRAHKTCDPANGLEGRRLPAAVHLEGLSCTGAAHGGCQARCLLFWKEAWLKRVDGVGQPALEPARPPAVSIRTSARAACTEQDIWAGARRVANDPDAAGPAFVCQSTELRSATEPLAAWDLRQYVEDYTSGNVRLAKILGSLVAFLCQQVVNAGIGLSTPVLLAYDGVQRLRGGAPYPWRVGTVPQGERTPSLTLNLQPGEWVRVKSYREILGTINEEGNNRGMSFDAEMVPYCGGTYQVLARVTRIINEKTGAMRLIKNECIMLDRVVCTACYAEHRRLCPRGIYAYWREIWLERVPVNGSGAVAATFIRPLASSDASPDPAGAPLHPGPHRCGL